jgi:cytochrome d ubiquinol oxidase subunit II
MALAIFWFILITVLWTGFFVLEGFDLGVGMLHAVVARDEPGRRAAINTIGPLWDGNEVWLIVAAAALFAAFPDWYATMFSGMYLLIVLLLAGLIVRGVSFEFRGKLEGARWHTVWDVLMTAGSLIVPFMIGVALADLVHGLPIGSDHEYTGGFGDLFTGYSVFAGITITLLCVVHGSTYLALKTTEGVRLRARRIARLASPIAALVVLAFVAWTHAASGKGVFINVTELIAVMAALGAAALTRTGREGWSFAATTVAMAATVVSLFVELYPNVMISSTNHAYNLTVQGSASGSYALGVMTVVAAVLVPIVMLYTAWTYHVFRLRLSAEHFQTADGVH